MAVRNLSWPRFGRFGVLALVSVACAACSPQPYAVFAQAGTRYAEAAEGVLVSYQRLYLDARSEQTLDGEALPAGRGGRSRARAEPVGFDLGQCGPGAATAGRAFAFEQRQCADVRRVRVIARLIAHTRLLGRYFTALNELATSDAPERAGAATGRLASAIKDIGERLQQDVGSVGALQPIVRGIVGLRQRAALRAELERNGEFIRQELRIQERTLAFLEQAIASEQAMLFTLQYRRRVSRPINQGSALENGDRWLDDRRELLLQVDQETGTRNARQALMKLSEAFDALLAGGTAEQQLGELISDINLVLDAVEPFVGRR